MHMSAPWFPAAGLAGRDVPWLAVPEQIRRETEAFEALIETKATMVVTGKASARRQHMFISATPTPFHASRVVCIHARGRPVSRHSKTRSRFSS